jgi:hypothetical protein
VCIQTTASASVPGFETRPVAGRRSKTVAFVAILALLTFGTLALGAKHADVGQSVNNLAIVYAHSRKAALGANVGQSVTIVYAQGKYSRTATAAVVAHQTGGGEG